MPQNQPYTPLQTLPDERIEARDWKSDLRDNAFLQEGITRAIESNFK